MANQLQDAILNAVDTLVNHRIENLQADKTVTATIVQCTNSLTGEYKVSYNGGYMYAYSQEGVTYTQNQSVYVLVPQGDFTQKKTIVSKTQAIEDDQNITFVSSALSNYNLIGKNPLSDNNKLYPVGLNSYLKNDYELLYQRDADGTFLSIDAQELSNNLKEAEALLIEASFLTRLPKAHKLSNSGFYGLQFVLAFADRDNVDEEGNAAVKYLSYTIDNNNMVGNPFQLSNWTEQYMIFPVDTENFLYVDSILAFSQDFVEADEAILADEWGDDIFVKDVEIYGLKTIGATNGDYRLALSMPQGSTFKSILADDSLQVVGKMTKLNDNLSDSTMFYWFAEDNRISADSEDYNMYGGAGWRYLKDKGNNYTLTTYGNENRAYENKYMVVAVYKETMILKDTFTLYNEAAARDLSISSSLGVKFSFDRGTPTLTCLVDGKADNFESGKVDGHKDEWFRFVWSKVSETGQTTIFNQTKEQLQAAYDQGILDGIGYAALSSLRAQILEMEGVEFTPGKNVLTYPVKQIDASATFKCSVYLKDSDAGEEYYIGTASIVLQNEGVASPTDYYIVIENGDQVFQYSESGVSPDDERYTDPLEVKNLECHFYDPAGLEVNNQTYAVKWLVPLESTMIVTPKEGMTLNPATNKIEWCQSQVYPMDIAADYDYQALNNQIKAIVTYQDEEYTQETTFLFTKIGENGTNGTDIVAKVYPIEQDSLPDNELLALELVGGVADRWNTGQQPNAKILGFNLYQRNEQLSISDSSISWTISGGASTKSKYASSTNGDFIWTNDRATSGMFRNQIVRGSARLDGNDYYAFYPVPVIDYKDAGKRYHIGLDATKTLKSVTYNADGRNPLYNKNQGIFITLGELNTNDLTNKYIVWYAEGGQPAKITGGYADNPRNAAFTLTYEKNSAEGQSVLVPRDNPDGTWELLTSLYILPNDVYDGAYSNNLVHGKIYSSKNAYQNNGNAEVDIYIPIYMSLNTFGLKSLNAWDGNHLEINEDENYILAPQIGAGTKDDNNRFTGVVMGTAQTYDQDEAQIGLLGYSHGKQSIFLDSETGDAVFGLPEQQASANNKYTEGRIELRPGKTSKIGMWNIGSRAIYNMSEPPEMRRVESGELDGNGEPVYKLQVQDGDGNWVDLEDSNKNVISNDNFKGAAPEEPAYKSYSHSSQYNVANASISIPPNAQGMILGANPAYISVKSMPLNEKNSNIDWNGANTTIKQGDSLEVEIDPVKSSVFSIYRHTLYDGQNKTEEWRRYPLVGINANGQFYTNAIEDGESSMGIGVIGAFHNSAADQKYVGAQFAWRGGNLFKFYVDSEDPAHDDNKKLFISTGSDVDVKDDSGKIKTKGDEYPREIGIYGKAVSLYAPTNGAENEPFSDHEIRISPDLAWFGHTDSYIAIPFSADEDAEITLINSLNVTTDTDKTVNFSTGDFNISAAKNTHTQGNISLVSANNFSVTAEKNISLIGTNGDLSFKSQYWSSSTNTNQSVTLTTSVLDKDKESMFDLRFSSSESFKSKLYSRTGWELTSKVGRINIKTTNSSDGIFLDSVPPNGQASQGTYLHLLAQDGGGSDFLLNSPHGSVRSISMTLQTGGTTNRNTIQITPGFSTNWGQFVGKINGTDDSIWATGNIRTANGNGYFANDVHVGTRSDYAGNIYVYYDNSTSKYEEVNTTKIVRWDKTWDNGWGNHTYSSLKNYIDDQVASAMARANAAFDLAASKANAKHTHDNYVTKSAFNTHFHYFGTGNIYFPTQWRDVTVDGQTASYIYGYDNLNGKRTNHPNTQL